MYTEVAEAMEEMRTYLPEKSALDCDDDDSGELSESISAYYVEACMPGLFLAGLAAKDIY